MGKDRFQVNWTEASDGIRSSILPFVYEGAELIGVDKLVEMANDMNRLIMRSLVLVSEDDDETFIAFCSSLAKLVGISHDQARLLGGSAINNLKTSRCEECHDIISEHGDALWRFELHPIRCADCVDALEKAGVDPFEARFVL